MYDSIKLGAYLASYAVRKGYFINQTKLQKLLYILYGAYLVNTNKQLLNESPQAWPYGPVFPRARKQFAGKSNLNYADISTSDYEDIRKDKTLGALIDATLHTFGNWSAQALSEWSHKEGSPWAVAFFTNGMEYGTTISDESIKQYFSSIMR